MIEVLVCIMDTEPTIQKRAYSSHRGVGNIPVYTDYRIPYAPNPLGRHPFNIITEEIYK